MFIYNIDVPDLYFGKDRSLKQYQDLINLPSYAKQKLTNHSLWHLLLKELTEKDKTNEPTNNTI